MIRRLGKAAAVVAASGVACAAPARPGDVVSDRVAAAAARGPGAVVDLRALAPFRWDRVHVFGPYTTDARIAREIGAPWAGRSLVADLDDRALVVFTHGGRVVAAFDQTRDRGDLVRLAGGSPYTPERARFVVTDGGRLVGGAPDHVLVPAPATGGTP
jgi:hypothetical protein